MKLYFLLGLYSQLAAGQQQYGGGNLIPATNNQYGPTPIPLPAPQPAPSYTPQPYQPNPQPQPYPQPQPQPQPQPYPQPQPQPQPYPQPQPQPYPQPSPYPQPQPQPQPQPYPQPQPQPYPQPQPRPNPQPYPQPSPQPQPRPNPQPYPQPSPQPYNYGQIPSPSSGGSYGPQPPQPNTYFPSPQPQPYPGGNGIGQPNPYGGGGGSGPDTSDPCFRKYSNCIIVNAQPYERRSTFTVEECKSLCSSSNSGIYACRSFVFDNVNNVCDLFAHTGNTFPARLLHYVGRDYYEPTGAPGCAGAGPFTTGAPGPGVTTPRPTFTTPSSGIDQCDPQVSRFTRVENFELQGNDDDIIPNTNEQQCLNLCVTRADCLSFEYVENANECVISGAATKPAGTGDLQPRNGVIYNERICVDATVANNCDQQFARFPQSILVGFAETVVDAVSFEDCLAQCLSAQATFGFACQSGMYYFQEVELNCILNTEDRNSQPDLFSEELDDIVDYFENGCRRRQIVQRFKSRRFQQRGAVIASVDEDVDYLTLNVSTGGAPSYGDWTMWSPCDREHDGRRTRYKKCKANNVKNCPFQSEWCNGKGKRRKSENSGVTRFAAIKETESERKELPLQKEDVITIDGSSILSNRKTNSTGAAFPCPPGICCPLTPGSCRIGMEISLHDGKLHYCTNPCNL